VKNCFLIINLTNEYLSIRVLVFINQEKYLFVYSHILIDKLTINQ